MSLSLRAAVCGAQYRGHYLTMGLKVSLFVVCGIASVCRFNLFAAVVTIK